MPKQDYSLKEGQTIRVNINVCQHIQNSIYIYIYYRHLKRVIMLVIQVVVPLEVLYYPLLPVPLKKVLLVPLQTIMMHGLILLKVVVVTMMHGPTLLVHLNNKNHNNKTTTGLFKSKPSFM
jgi:hypothetical protein